MFERYTERARRVIFFARYEASQLGSLTIETEHLLLGLIREDKNLTNRFLRNASDFQSIRDEIRNRVKVGEKVSTSIDLPLTEECKRILKYAHEEAEMLNHPHIGTEHLLLGILREEKCLAAEILRERGLQLSEVREKTAQLAPDRHRIPGETSSLTSVAEHTILHYLQSNGFRTSSQHAAMALQARERQDWEALKSDLQLFMESLVEEIKSRLNGDETVFEGFEWQTAVRELRTGLSSEDDASFRWRLAMLLAEVLIKRFEQRMNS